MINQPYAIPYYGRASKRLIYRTHGHGIINNLWLGLRGLLKRYGKKVGKRTIKALKKEAPKVMRDFALEQQPLNVQTVKRIAKKTMKNVSKDVSGGLLSDVAQKLKPKPKQKKRSVKRKNVAVKLI